MGAILELKNSPGFEHILVVVVSQVAGELRLSSLQSSTVTVVKSINQSGVEKGGVKSTRG